MTSVRVVVTSVEGFVEKLIKRLTLNVTANLVEDTPVDTGWARANWVPQIGSPRSTTAGTRMAAENGQINLGPQSSGLSSVLRYKLGPNVHITNNVPYIESLNAGSSRQAPSAFIQGAIARATKTTTNRSR